MASFLGIELPSRLAHAETEVARSGCANSTSTARERNRIDPIPYPRKQIAPGKTVATCKIVAYHSPSVYQFILPRVKGMLGYRCYILDADDHILQGYDLDCETDAQAKARAESLLAEDPYYRSAEVWKATSRVMRLERPPQRVRRATIFSFARRTLGSPA
jgi:hypothetical protein